MFPPPPPPPPLAKNPVSIPDDGVGMMCSLHRKLNYNTGDPINNPGENTALVLIGELSVSLVQLWSSTLTPNTIPPLHIDNGWPIIAMDGRTPSLGKEGMGEWEREDEEEV